MSDWCSGTAVQWCCLTCMSRAWAVANCCSHCSVGWTCALSLMHHHHLGVQQWLLLNLAQSAALRYSLRVWCCDPFRFSAMPPVSIPHASRCRVLCSRVFVLQRAQKSGTKNIPAWICAGSEELVGCLWLCVVVLGAPKFLPCPWAESAGGTRGEIMR